MNGKKIEITVGLFMVLGFGALVYLALQLGEVPWLSSATQYSIMADFDNVSGIKRGGAVQIARVTIGEVASVRLGEDDTALLELRIDNAIKVPTDSIASVKSKGLIGDKYIQLNLGGDETYFQPGEILRDTESSVDLESLISKFAFGSAE